MIVDDDPLLGRDKVRLGSIVFFFGGDSGAVWGTSGMSIFMKLRNIFVIFSPTIPFLSSRSEGFWIRIKAVCHRILALVHALLAVLYLDILDASNPPIAKNFSKEILGLYF